MKFQSVQVQSCDLGLFVQNVLPFNEVRSM